MRKTFFAAVLGVLAAGCTGGGNPYLAAQHLERIPETKYLAKMVTKNGGAYYNYDCSAVSLGGGKFLTSAKCIGRTNYIADIGENIHKADIIKTGHEYSSGEDFIQDWHKNYAVLYAPTLQIPAMDWSDFAPSINARVCVVFSPEYSKKFAPIKHCGKVLEHAGQHYGVRWDSMEKITGYWGAPVFYEGGAVAGKLAGIISYQFANDITGSGVLSLIPIKSEIK